MASKSIENRPQGFIPTLIICIVVAFIIIHSAFLKLTSSPDVKLEKESSTLDSSVKVQEKGAARFEEPQSVQEPLVANKSSASKESFETEMPSETPSRIQEKTPSGSSLERGFHFHMIGNYERAADEYAKVIASARHQNDYTIQLLLACQVETILEAFKNAETPEQLYYIPWHHNGRECFKVCMSLFNSKGQAEKNRRQISKHFLKGGNNPIVISVSMLAKGSSRQ